MATLAKKTQRTSKTECDEDLAAIQTLKQKKRAPTQMLESSMDLFEDMVFAKNVALHGFTSVEDNFAIVEVYIKVINLSLIHYFPDESNVGLGIEMDNEIHSIFSTLRKVLKENMANAHASILMTQFANDVAKRIIESADAQDNALGQQPIDADSNVGPIAQPEVFVKFQRLPKATEDQIIGDMVKNQSVDQIEADDLPTMLHGVESKFAELLDWPMTRILKSMPVHVQKHNVLPECC